MVTYWHFMDAIYKAIADETRRSLLDALRQEDGQTLTDLESRLGMTRFGVSKHLKILEAAGLITTHKSGRFKYHYLNAAPLQQVIDRWIEPLVQKPLARAALDLKLRLEGNTAMTTDTQARPDFILETYIKTTPEKLWEALTSEPLTARYNALAGAIQSDFKPGSPYKHILPNGESILSGEILAVTPLKHLNMTFVPGWVGPDAVASRCVYDIEVVGETCKLTIKHFDIPAGQEGVKEGWAKIMSNLKSLLETGEVLTF